MSVIQTLRDIVIARGDVAYITTDGRELTVRCVYCGDSDKSASHAHFYISFEPPYPFYCQRCETRGMLDDAVLRDFDVDDPEITREVHRRKKEFLRDTVKRSKSVKIIQTGGRFRFPKYKFGKRFMKKLDYIRGRIGGPPFELEDVRRYRIVESLENLIVLNGLDNMTRDDDAMDKVARLDSTSVCFLSSDHSHAIFRSIEKEPWRRYTTVNLVHPLRIGHKIYSIKKIVDPLIPSLELVQAEGIFDIISLYRNVYKGEETPNRVFFASNGKGFALVPSMLQRMGFLNLRMHVYSDTDVHRRRYGDVLPLSRLDGLKVTYNVFEGEKDFGVPVERIELKTYKFK
jgi:hypothetical protein